LTLTEEGRRTLARADHSLLDEGVEFATGLERFNIDFPLVHCAPPNETASGASPGRRASFGRGSRAPRLAGSGPVIVLCFPSHGPPINVTQNTSRSALIHPVVFEPAAFTDFARRTEVGINLR